MHPEFDKDDQDSLPTQFFQTRLFTMSIGSFWTPYFFIKSSFSASTHALYPSRWYAANIRDVKNWLAVLCCGKMLQQNSDKPHSCSPWQNSQQQRVKLSTCSFLRTIPPSNPCRGSNWCKGGVYSQGSLSKGMPSDGCLGAINRISPSSLLLYCTPNLSK